MRCGPSARPGSKRRRARSRPNPPGTPAGSSRRSAPSTAGRPGCPRARRRSGSRSPSVSLRAGPGPRCRSGASRRSPWPPPSEAIVYYVQSLSNPTPPGGSLQAAVLTGPGLMEVREIEEPTAGPGEASVRIRAVGICGTDLSIFKGKIPVAYPRIIGHEMVGQVLVSAEGGPEPGTRVIVDPNVACGRCARCREGRANLCVAGWLLGRDRDGALRERVVAPAENLYGLPEGLEDHVAPLIQVLTTCVHGQRLAPIFPGDSTVVVGLGV